MADEGKLRGISAQHAILEVLFRGENYGLGIREAVKERTKGALDLGPGTLYPTLHALERDGFVTSSELAGSAERGGRPKIMYRLTAEGRRAATSVREQVGVFYGLLHGLLPEGA